MYKRKTRNGLWSKEDMAKAIEEVIDGNRKLVDIAKHYNLPAPTLCRKVQQEKIKRTANSHECACCGKEPVIYCRACEKYLCQMCKNCHQRLDATKHHKVIEIVECAENIIVMQKDTDCRVSLNQEAIPSIEERNQIANTHIQPDPSMELAHTEDESEETNIVYNVQVSDRNANIELIEVVIDKPTPKLLTTDSNGASSTMNIKPGTSYGNGEAFNTDITHAIEDGNIKSSQHYSTRSLDVVQHRQLDMNDNSTAAQACANTKHVILKAPTASSVSYLTQTLNNNCKVHSTCVIQYCCRSCTKKLCQLCLNEHVGHDIIPIEDAGDTLEPMMIKVRRQLRDNVTRACSLEDNMLDVIRKYKGVISNMEEQYFDGNNILSILDSHRHNFQDKVNDIKTISNDDINKLNVLSFDSSNVHSTLRKIRDGENLYNYINKRLDLLKLDLTNVSKIEPKLREVETLQQQIRDVYNEMIHTLSLSSDVDNTTSNRTNIMVDQSIVFAEHRRSVTEQVKSNTKHGTSIMEQVTSNTEHDTSNMEHVTSNTEQVTSNTDHAMSNTEQVTTNTEHLTSNTEHVTSNTEQVTSNTEHVTSNTEHVTSNTEHVTSNTEHVMAITNNSNTEQTSLIIEQETCNTEQSNLITEHATSNTEQVTSVTEQAALITEKNTSVSEQISPIADHTSSYVPPITDQSVHPSSTAQYVPDNIEGSKIELINKSFNVPDTSASQTYETVIVNSAMHSLVSNYNNPILQASDQESFNETEPANTENNNRVNVTHNKIPHKFINTTGDTMNVKDNHGQTPPNFISMPPTSGNKHGAIFSTPPFNFVSNQNNPYLSIPSKYLHCDMLTNNIHNRQAQDINNTLTNNSNIHNPGDTVVDYSRMMLQQNIKPRYKIKHWLKICEHRPGVCDDQLVLFDFCTNHVFIHDMSDLKQYTKYTCDVEIWKMIRTSHDRFVAMDNNTAALHLLQLKDRKLRTLDTMLRDTGSFVPLICAETDNSFIKCSISKNDPSDDGNVDDDDDSDSCVNQYKMSISRVDITHDKLVAHHITTVTVKGDYPEFPSLTADNTRLIIVTENGTLHTVDLHSQDVTTDDSLEEHINGSVLSLYIGTRDNIMIGDNKQIHMYTPDKQHSMVQKMDDRVNGITVNDGRMIVCCQDFFDDEDDPQYIKVFSDTHLQSVS